MGIFRAVVERVKNILFMSAANQIEADTVSRAAEQKAELHRQAKQYEEEGLTDLAKQLRARADAIDLARPLHAVVPGTGYLVGETGALSLTASAEPPLALPAARESEERGKKKKDKSAKA